MIEVTWTGPCSWPTFENENGLPSIPKYPGVYLQTFRYQGGYLIYSAGLSHRPVPERFREHTRNYMNGEYNVLDIAEAQRGIRKEIWHGWGYARKHRAEFEERKSAILDDVRKQLAGFCVSVANVGERPRVCERLEASIMDNLYHQPSPFCDIPNKGMQLAPRWATEEPITVKSRCEVSIHGLPHCLEI